MKILTKITGILREDQYLFMTISRSLLLRIKKNFDKSYGENANTRISLSNISFVKNRSV